MLLCSWVVEKELPTHSSAIEERPSKNLNGDSGQKSRSLASTGRQQNGCLDIKYHAQGAIDLLHGEWLQFAKPLDKASPIDGSYLIRQRDAS